MNKWTQSIPPRFTGLLHDRRGVAALVVAGVATALIGVVGFAVDVGVVLSARQALQANTNAAALNGAYQWNQPTGGQSAALSAAQAWNSSNALPLVSSTQDLGPPPLRHDNRPPDLRDSWRERRLADADRNVPTYFARVLGMNSWTVSAKAIDGRRGRTGESP